MPLPLCPAHRLCSQLPFPCSLKKQRQSTCIGVEVKELPSAKVVPSDGAIFEQCRIRTYAVSWCRIELVGLGRYSEMKKSVTTQLVPTEASDQPGYQPWVDDLGCSSVIKIENYTCRFKNWPNLQPENYSACFTATRFKKNKRKKQSLEVYKRRKCRLLTSFGACGYSRLLSPRGGLKSVDCLPPPVLCLCRLCCGTLAFHWIE